MQPRHPIQKLCAIPHEADGQQLLLAASGHTISCIALPQGELLSQWTSQHGFSDDDDDHEDANEEGNDANGDRPSKRRKLSSNGHEPMSRQASVASDVSIEIVAERKKGERKKSRFVDTKLSNISHMLATSDGKYVVAVTTEDKAIRVLKVASSGKLTLISERCLPKKLCALRLTTDEGTILAADKFGDVYSVPLHQSRSWVRKKKKDNDDDQMYKPSATELTVHTKGNLEALRQQQEQKRAKVKRETPDFEHQLLLGHVSLLTDLVAAEGQVNGKARPFILTSDRDEHIRVSRGIPQAHVIENFCLGHREFVTRLCVPTFSPETLIVGNGEPSLRLFDWQKGELLQTIMIESVLPTRSEQMSPDEEADCQLGLPEGRSYDKLAISGIWPISFSITANADGEPQYLILVAIEGSPCLLTYVFSPNQLRFHESITLSGNVLDVSVVSSAQKVLVSVDTVHKPWSMKAYRDVQNAQEFPLLCLEIKIDGKQMNGVGARLAPIDQPFASSDFTQSLPETPHLTPEGESKSNYDRVFSGLGEFLYGLENLRKKRGTMVDDLTLMEASDKHGVQQEEPEEE